MDRYDLYWQNGLWHFYKTDEQRVIQSGADKKEMINYARRFIVKNDGFVVIQRAV